MMSTWHEFSYESMDNVTSVLLKHDFLATFDIASTNRSVSICPEHRKFMGLRWEMNGQECFYTNTRLCFGQKCAPYISSTLTNFIVACMENRGFERTFYYLDDFIVLGGFLQVLSRCSVDPHKIVGGTRLLCELK